MAWFCVLKTSSIRSPVLRSVSRFSPPLLQHDAYISPLASTRTPLSLGELSRSLPAIISRGRLLSRALSVQMAKPDLLPIQRVPSKPSEQLKTCLCMRNHKGNHARHHVLRFSASTLTKYRHHRTSALLP
ncbi:unnamed protein product [Scytosiphon promiscuus]